MAAHALPLLRWSRTTSSFRARSFPPAAPRRLFSALRRPAAASCEAGSKAMLKGVDYPELEKWVQAQGFRPGQAMMLWKCLNGNNVWAHCHNELAGLNKDFRKMITEHAYLKALTVKDILTASDGTREGQDNCLCFKSSGLCHELSVLLHWKDGFEKASVNSRNC